MELEDLRREATNPKLQSRIGEVLNAHYLTRKASTT